MVAFAFLACAGGAPATPDAAGTEGPSLLFIGNSLTASNDLAGRVTALSRATAHPIRASAVTGSGYSLADHLADGRAVRAIRSGGHTMVALQQGPSTLPASRAELIASARTFAEEIRRAGGRPALLVAWPLPGQTFEAVSASYRAAAAAIDADVLPAGEALGEVTRRHPALRLFTSDGFHPSPLGTDVAALAVVCARHPEDAPALPEAFGVLQPSMDLDERRALVEAACEAGRLAPP